MVGRPKKTDSAEVYVGEEFLGVLFVDDEDGDRSFNFTMAILDTDLEDLGLQQTLRCRILLPLRSASRSRSCPTPGASGSRPMPM